MSSKKHRKPRSLKVPRFTGDHGPETAAQRQGTVIEAVRGEEHNNTGRRRRVNVLESLLRSDKITQRQYQAGEAIEKAYCRVQMLSSGSELKEWVQSSPKPDAAVSRQCDVIGHYAHVMKAVPRTQRKLISHVCEKNQPLRTSGLRRAGDRLRSVLDRVADHLKY